MSPLTPQSSPLSSPFAHNNQSVRQLMFKVQLAVIPALLVHIYLFGFGIVIQWVLAFATLLVVEFTMLKLRNRPVRPFITDMSAMITATVLVFCIPAGAPWWIIVSGTAFALIFGKHIYGGLGYNPFNPAMLGYAFLLLSFPVQMTQWTAPTEILDYAVSFTNSLHLIFTGNLPQAALGANLDMISAATPLSQLQIGLTQGQGVTESLTPIALEAQTHYQNGSVINGFFYSTAQFFSLNSWAWVNVAFLIGGLWLLAVRAIRWQYPVGFLSSLSLISFIFYTIDPNTYPPVDFMLLSGGTMLAAFFIITDPVTSSTTPKGRFIFACGIGILVYVIRTWGIFPDGITFAVLLMNIAVPLIDQYTQPRVYGHK
ncbi:MAG: RnfABCDGE type electron transport complex subunit D [Thiomicrorhabdus sp.]|nr:RnfABCDGE type electron transport complex subunit D [Thiomicrorhabdus sp.]